MFKNENDHEGSFQTVDKVGSFFHLEIIAKKWYNKYIKGRCKYDY